MNNSTDECPCTPDCECKTDTYRIEMRFDFTGTRAELSEVIKHVRADLPNNSFLSSSDLYNQEVTTIFNSKWEEINVV